MKNKFALELISVSKIYRSKSDSVKALNNVSFFLKKGDLCGVMGPSGSGKTTFLKVSAGLLKPDSGSVILFGTDIYGISDDERQRFRRVLASFMFQEGLLIETLTLKENVELPLIVEGVPRKVRKKLALKMLEEVGLEELADRKPMEVSGGERRRVTLARCLINKPQILFLDEPTSNLDSKTALEIVDLLKTINNEGATIFLSTHDTLIANQLENILFLRDGKITKLKVQKSVLNKVGESGVSDD